MPAYSELQLLPMLRSSEELKMGMRIGQRLDALDDKLQLLSDRLGAVERKLANLKVEVTAVVKK